MRLQSLLDASYERAGSHLRSIFTPERRLSAQDLVGELRGVAILHLATVTSAGEPVVAPVDELFFRGRFWFGSGATSLRFRHIRRRPQVSASFARGETLCVLVRGSAREIDKSTPESLDFRDYNREVYGPEWDSWGHWSNAPYAVIEARRIFASSLGGDSSAAAVER